MYFYIIILAIVIIAVYALSVQRQLVRAKEYIDNSFSQIGVNQQSRWDALTQLAKATSAYSSHEYRTLMDVIDSRKSNTTLENLESNEQAIQSALSRVNVLAEQYPDLKASQVYIETMKSVNDYENKVRVARMVFNDSVTKYNRIVKQLPSSIFASMFGFSVQEYLNADSKKSEMPELNF
ncbi:LemA protein [Peptoniphilus asaccharolyticus DSM 20463]|uniref:LemA protein n=1 Tax=Peptoniphilus asaccharolyticus DSM 20463 TaxID=573058 RepID=A0A1W1VB41_PEPAS|nr:LemA family protein [Peptoniphilus asaccharolyticus]MBL7575692.1 LemA family protein [Peptoniphilus asaccharolyticus]SMB90535.1 LemA protein [Peptoniphilus asaccharolyticus DSM 20463]